MRTTTAEVTVKKVRELFGRFGLPETSVTDNGPQFCSKEFKVFLRENGVKHVKCAPYHPSSNGLAERFVRTLKEALRKDVQMSPDVRLANFLLSYRNTPHATTQQSPAELLLGRKLRTRLDLIKPSTDIKVRHNQFTQTINKRGRERNFVPGDKVYVKNFRPGARWLPARVIEKVGRLSYRLQVSTSHGSFVWKRHQDHLRKRDIATSSTDEHQFFIPRLPTAMITPAAPGTPPGISTGCETSTDLLPSSSEENRRSPDDNDVPVEQASPALTAQQEKADRPYALCIRRPPDRYSPS